MAKESDLVYITIYHMSYDIANKKWLIEKWFATKENLFGTFSSTIHGSVPAIDSDFELKIICVD